MPIDSVGKRLYISGDGYTPRRTSMVTMVVNETTDDVWPACRSGRFDNFMVMSSTSPSGFRYNTAVRDSFQLRIPIPGICNSHAPPIKIIENS